MSIAVSSVWDLEPSIEPLQPDRPHVTNFLARRFVQGAEREPHPSLRQRNPAEHLCSTAPLKGTRRRNSSEGHSEREVEQLRAKIGELTMELDWLQKKSRHLSL